MTGGSPKKTDVTAEAVQSGDRAALARAITLMESRRPDHREAARALLQALMPSTGKAVRVGITGVPGVGKSTAIDTLGSMLTEQGHKTRMARLSVDPTAFIRPSPSSGTLGGVAGKTRETMLLCEAAGFDVILVETVGVGQSETAVADLTDFFLVLMLPGAGDELQGIKKGILELADLIAVNKADDAGARAKAAAAEYKAALHILTPASTAWTPSVLTVSGLTGQGLDALWAKVLDHRSRLEATGELAAKRRAQDTKWMWALVHERLHERLTQDPALRRRVPEIEQAIAQGTLSPNAAAAEIVALLGL
jgi:LAO/AO transport system kinase